MGSKGKDRATVERMEHRAPPLRVYQAGYEATRHDICDGPGACRFVPWKLADGSWAMSHRVGPSTRPTSGVVIDDEWTTAETDNPRTEYLVVAQTYPDDETYVEHVRAERESAYLASHPESRPRKLAGWRVDGHELRTIDAIMAEAERRGLSFDRVGGSAVVVTGDMHRRDALPYEDRLALILATALPAIEARMLGTPLPSCALDDEPAAGVTISGLVCARHRDEAVIAASVPASVGADASLPAVHVPARSRRTATGERVSTPALRSPRPAFG